MIKLLLLLFVTGAIRVIGVTGVTGRQCHVGLMDGVVGGAGTTRMSCLAEQAMLQSVGGRGPKEELKQRIKEAVKEQCARLDRNDSTAVDLA